MCYEDLYMYMCNCVFIYMVEHNMWVGRKLYHWGNICNVQNHLYILHISNSEELLTLLKLLWFDQLYFSNNFHLYIAICYLVYSIFWHIFFSISCFHLLWYKACNSSFFAHIIPFKNVFSYLAPILFVNIINFDIFCANLRFIVSYKENLTHFFTFTERFFIFFCLACFFFSNLLFVSSLLIFIFSSILKNSFKWVIIFKVAKIML